jgi:hypothetical protein
MKRLENETYEDYKQRRKDNNLIEKIRLKGCMVWSPHLQGQRVGKFTDKDSFIMNDKFTHETIRKDLIEKGKIIDKTQDLIETTSKNEATV